MRIREENPGDEEAIRRVVADGFGRDQEARLVDHLRKDGDLVVSLVAEEGGEICGHVALSRMKCPQSTLALAPVSVLTKLQGRGIGTALVRLAIERARELGNEIVFVVGEPTYYKRFGFALALRQRQRRRFRAAMRARTSSR